MVDRPCSIKHTSNHRNQPLNPQDIQSSLIQIYRGPRLTCCAAASLSKDLFWAKGKEIFYSDRNRSKQVFDVSGAADLYVSPDAKVVAIKLGSSVAIYDRQRQAHVISTPIASKSTDRTHSIGYDSVLWRSNTRRPSHPTGPSVKLSEKVKQAMYYSNSLICLVERGVQRLSLRGRKWHEWQSRSFGKTDQLVIIRQRVLTTTPTSVVILTDKLELLFIIVMKNAIIHRSMNDLLIWRNEESDTVRNEQFESVSVISESRQLGIGTLPTCDHVICKLTYDDVLQFLYDE
uniref:WD_REPEATS_REGION domain-containing protein n=1 Tax=Panagrellus redivivus TaxID=6233 RepID=A0A7E4VIV8_PANRE